MLRAACIILSIAISSSAQSQTSDFIVLRKNGKIVTTYMTGKKISLITYSGVTGGTIDRIANDSIYLNQYDIRFVPGYGNVSKLDTVATYHTQVALRDVTGLTNSPDKKFNWSGSGGALLGGGTLITLFGLGTWVFSRPNSEYYASPYLVGSAAVLAAAGYLMIRAGAKGILLGKKFTLEYVKVK